MKPPPIQLSDDVRQDDQNDDQNDDRNDDWHDDRHDDRNDVRHDVDTMQVKRAYPGLPTSKDWSQHKTMVKHRSLYMMQRDTYAYERLLRDNCIDFRPKRCASLSCSTRLKFLFEDYIVHLENQI